jgi:hypothetical protein
MSEYDCINNFNSILKDFAQNMAYICPDTIIGQNIGYINKTLDNLKEKEKFIDLFCAKILIFKPVLDNDDNPKEREQFFYKRSYDDDLKGTDAEGFDRIFIFKDIWKNLKQENKDMVILYMKALAEIAQQYYCITQNI